MKWASLIFAVVVGVLALSLVACGDDSGDSAEELCCSCIEQNGCGDASFDFSICVFDGYRGATPMAINQTCLANSCADDCRNSSFN